VDKLIKLLITLLRGIKLAKSIDKLLWITDLDNTMIFSYKYEYKEKNCIEVMDTKELSFITKKSHKKFENLVNKNVDNFEVIPLTTRAIHQYVRIDLLNGKKMHYALVANGAILLVDGKVDEEWFMESKVYVKDAKEELNKAMDLLNKDEHIYLDVRFVDEVFVFTKSHKPLETMEMLKKHLDMNKVFIDNVKDKVYVFPIKINKGIAVERIKKRLGIKEVIASGDSRFDYPMLSRADIKIIPKHSELDGMFSDAYISDKETMEYTDFILDKVNEVLHQNGYI